jgi:hypothetical protein
VSRGPGQIERAIVSVLEGNPDNAFTVSELCERAYGVVPSKKHRVSMLRAMRSVASKSTDFATLVKRGVGAVLYNVGSHRSFEMAKAKLEAQPLFRRLWLSGHWYSPPSSPADLEQQLRDGVLPTPGRGGDHRP